MGKLKREKQDAARILDCLKPYIKIMALLSYKVEVEGDKGFALPLLVNLAFAAEQCLKCLIALLGQLVPRTHNLQVLWDELRAVDQKMVLQNHRHYSAQHKIAPADSDAYFLSAVASNQNSVEDLRYLFETTKGKAELNSLPSVAVSIYDYIFQLKPEWRNRALKSEQLY